MVMGEGGGGGGCRLRPRATSHRRCSRAAMAAASVRLREGLRDEEEEDVCQNTVPAGRII